LSLGRFEGAHVCDGRNPIACPGEPDLADNPPLWRAAWTKYRDALLSQWIAERPGSRPPAWWRWDGRAERPDPEDEPEALRRRGELADAEFAAIRRKALELVEYNRGRDPHRPRDNWIGPRPLHRFAAKFGLLDAAERRTLNIDSNGDDL
jgi:hypothetical protein